MDTSFSEATATPPPTPPPSTSRTLSINDLLNPPPTTTPTKNKRARAHELTRDQKIEICAFRKYLKWTYEDIAKNTPFTLRQVQSACQDDAPVTPKKNKGRKGLICTPEKDQLKACIVSCDYHCSISWYDLRFFLPPNLSIYGETALIRALRDLGFQCCLRLRKIKRTEANKRKRVAFARQMLRLRLRPQDWEDVIFSDETWATNDPMRKKWITIHDAEDPEAFALLRRCPDGWMFWGCFAGGQKGPGFTWMQEWGGISAYKYILYILLMVRALDHECFNGYGLFQQDNAPSYRALDMKAAIRLMGLTSITWPAVCNPCV